MRTGRLLQTGISLVNKNDDSFVRASCGRIVVRYLSFALCRNLSITFGYLTVLAIHGFHGSLS